MVKKLATMLRWGFSPKPQPVFQPGPERLLRLWRGKNLGWRKPGKITLQLTGSFQQNLERNVRVFLQPGQEIQQHQGGAGTPGRVTDKENFVHFKIRRENKGNKENRRIRGFWVVILILEFVEAGHHATPRQATQFDFVSLFRRMSSTFCRESITDKTKTFLPEIRYTIRHGTRINSQ